MRIRCLKVHELTQSVCENNFIVKYMLLNETAVFINRKNKVIQEQDVIDASKHRNKIICPIFYECGGCDFLHIKYEEQLRIKTDHIYKMFEKKKLKTRVSPIIGSEDPWHYRHKVVLSATTTKKKLRLGLHQDRSKRIIPFLNCYIQDKKINKIMRSIEQLLNKFKITAYNLDKNSGIIKHILIRKSYASQKFLVVFVTQGKLFPNSKSIINQLTKLHPNVLTITQNIHNKKTHIVLLDEEKILYGKGYIEDEIEGLTYRLSAKSFYQINPKQMVNLYKKALELADVKATDTVIDTYSGIGTISLLIAKKAKKVFAIETNNSAHRDALFNKKLNAISNIEFINSDVNDFIKMFTGVVDCLIMDPTREGASNAFLNSVLSLKPKKIIYISCEPKTQVNDLTILSKKYKLKAIAPVDMFSQTKHIETIALLELGS